MMPRESLSKIGLPFAGLLIVVGMMCCACRPAWADELKDLWPGKTVVIDAAIGERVSWPPFPKDQALDFLRNVSWQEVFPTYETTVCGNMWFHDNGSIDYEYSRSRKCGDIYKYDVVKVTDYYIVIRVYDDGEGANYKYRVNCFWSIMRVDKYRVGIVRCGEPYLNDLASELGGDPIHAPLDRLVDVWNHSSECNPDLMPPDRRRFWGGQHGPTLYDVMDMDHNPHWSLDGYDPSPVHDRLKHAGH
jgi:hypothetical protein